MNVHVTSGCSNAMNMAPAIEFWSHCLEHFVSVLHHRMCACRSYRGGDVHEKGGDRMTQEVSPHPINRMRCWKVGHKVLAVSCVCILPRPSPPPVFAIMQPPRARCCHMQ